MLSWFEQNLGTIVISLILIGIVTLVTMGMIRDKKKGKASCCGGCAHCAMCGKCHKTAVGSEKNRCRNART